MSAEAMKFAMMVVMTMWLPRFAWSQPGTNAQRAPKAQPARMASGTTIQGDQDPIARQTSPTPRPPM
jgi:hypothetical protein